MTAEISILKRGNEEQMLVDHLQRLTSFTERGWAIHIHLSKLGTRTRNENPSSTFGPRAPSLPRYAKLTPDSSISRIRR